MKARAVWGVVGHGPGRILSGKSGHVAACSWQLAQDLVIADVCISFSLGHCNFSCMGGEHTHEPNKIYGTGADSSYPFGNAAKPGV